jgi:ABC-type multidrug transport system fused ATPase/permease subunit
VPQPPSLSPQEKKKLASLIPTKETTSSIRKLLELARPERQTIIWAIGLLIVSSTISMSVPLTIGKLIDFFASSDSVRALLPSTRRTRALTHRALCPTQERFLGLSFPVAAAVLTSFFILGAACNAARAYLMRLSGQRIIARVRKDAYRNVLRQEVEFADKGAGDILSRLGSDTTIVGESVTNNLSDGLRALISAIVGGAPSPCARKSLSFTRLIVDSCFLCSRRDGLHLDEADDGHAGRRPTRLARRRLLRPLPA